MFFGVTGLPHSLGSLVREMRQRGYPYNIVLYRVWERGQSACYRNHGWSVPNSYENVFCFREYRLFAEGQAWCAGLLPRTYFKPVASR